MSAQALVVLTTCKNLEDARRLVRSLVEDRLVACGTLVPGATSVYRWQGAVAEESEVVVLLKTQASRWDALAEAVRQRHPYDVPELLALPITLGLDAYLTWVGEEVAG
jgi:periplasmic divalent cation tolerance protein